MPEPSADAAAAANRPIWPKAAAAAAAIALLWIVGRYAGHYVPRFAAWVEGLGVWAPTAFIAAYALAAVAFVPGVVLTLAAGAIFGVIDGTLYVFVGATIGACAAFLIARYLARDAVERRIRQSPRFTAIDRAIGREGLRMVLLLRLSPVFPFNLLNYALGLTKVTFHHYVIGCIGMLPATLLYVYSGKVAGDVAAAAAGATQPRGAASYAVLGLGLVATIAVTVVITRAARRALDAQVEAA